MEPLRKIALDELFFVVRGSIAMEYRLDGSVAVERFGAGELLRVPKGIEHRPVADADTEILIFERTAIRNTGAVFDEMLTNDAVPL